MLDFEGIFYLFAVELLQQAGVLLASVDQSNIKGRNVKTKAHKRAVLFWLHGLRKLDISKLENRRKLIDTFINAIYLDDDANAILVYRRAFSSVYHYFYHVIKF